ncbi:hypothetical protein OWR29_33470 [Actinoplanes sp. Pm04-4]|uniref:Bulb-type lectin domain-containing protein n=1 Tax=Paractinoplanes pyxinae TaxID=2997416 RepID=A0ABT4BAU4_9ACTN|nr:hypothetical protein [Actinoplanes pyxinae]MCY1142930.1 hypothetical protein [Actinoplanes pyxinae]
MTDNDRREVNRAAIALVAAVILSMGAAGYAGFWIAHDDEPSPQAAAPTPAPVPTAFPSLAIPLLPPPVTTPPPSTTSAPAKRATPTPTPTSTPPRTTRPPAKTPRWEEEVIAATSVLTTGQSWSTNRLRLTVTTGGNLVLQDQGRTVWQTGTKNGVKLVMQNDGHLVLYDANNGTAFSSGTAGNPGAVLILRPDGNMVIALNGRILFETGTGD